MQVNYICKLEINKTHNLQIQKYIYTSCLIKFSLHRCCNGCIFDLSVVDRVFESWLGQTKDHKISISTIRCFSAHHASLRSKSRLIASESGYCVRVDRHVYLLVVVSVSQHYKNPTLCVGLVQSRYIIIISCAVNCSLNDIQYRKGHTVIDHSERHNF